MRRNPTAKRSLPLLLAAIAGCLSAAPAARAGDAECSKYLPSVGKTVKVPCASDAPDETTSTSAIKRPAELSLDELKQKYGSVEDDGGDWVVRRQVAPLTTGFKPSTAKQLASGEQISLSACKISCREASNCVALYWGSAHASNSDVCYLYDTQIIDTVASQSGGVWFKHAR